MCCKLQRGRRKCKILAYRALSNWVSVDIVVAVGQLFVLLCVAQEGTYLTLGSERLQWCVAAIELGVALRGVLLLGP